MMSMTLKIAKYQLKDSMRSAWLISVALFFLLATDALFRFGGGAGGGERVIVSLMNVVLLIVPLIAIVIGTMYLYSSREYIELLLSQPVDRPSLFLGLFVGLTLPLIAGFVAGVGLPFVYHGALFAADTGPLPLLLLCGALLTVIFVAFAFAIALRTEDRIRGIGAALLVWLFFTVVYGGLVLVLLQLFVDYPLQKPTIIASLLNPVDLGRILLLLRLDISALMGFTGAVFSRFFGSGLGQLVSMSALLVWVAVPFWLGRRAFVGKNF
jgi:Cu-processing system permease protein